MSNNIGKSVALSVLHFELVIRVSLLVFSLHSNMKYLLQRTVHSYLWSWIRSLRQERWRPLGRGCYRGLLHDHWRKFEVLRSKLLREVGWSLIIAHGWRVEAAELVVHFQLKKFWSSLQPPREFLIDHLTLYISAGTLATQQRRQSLKSNPPCCSRLLEPFQIRLFEIEIRQLMNYTSTLCVFVHQTAATSLKTLWKGNYSRSSS